MGKSQILTPLQSALLEEFFASSIGRSFFLTGGTALAAFYLQHRLSQDLDLFTTDDVAFHTIVAVMDELGRRLNCTLLRGVSAPAFEQFYFVREGDRLQVDVVRDIDVQFGEHQDFNGVIVDSPENIGANKVTAIFSRVESKDFVDLYFLLQNGQDFKRLIAMAKQKDSGLSEFYLAGMMRQVMTLKRLPVMLRPLDLETLKSFYLELAEKLMRDIKPE
jgi:Nucleotidyl transferase AbiEii toxin, Type IV TA system